MWWQILPSFAITVAGITIPAITFQVSAYLYFGSVHGRDMDSKFFRYRYHRDERILGHELINQTHALGLDGIPDD